MFSLKGFWEGGFQKVVRRPPRRVRPLMRAVSRALSQKRVLTECCGKLGELCEKLGDFTLAHN